MTETPDDPPLRREAPIAMAPDEFRKAGHRLVDLLADFLARIPDGPVNRDEQPEALRALLGDDRLPQGGADAASLLESAATLLFEHSLFNAHPRFFGYITASPAPIGILGDFLASALNANVGAWRLSPIATEIESQTIRWLAELVGMPQGTGGVLVSGGNVANIVALIAARRAAADWDVRKAGVNAEGAAALRVYATQEVHTWLQKAVDVAGLGADSIQVIPTDRQQRMDAAALAQAIENDRAKGERPMMVVATAGTVSTGAIDPLPAIVEHCRKAGVWLHVDGCYGGVAACVPDAPADLKALAHADSVAIDPHKWLYAPLEAGALLVREPGLLRDAFTFSPAYYHFGQEVTNYLEFGLQNSRGFRALKVWLALRQNGREGYVKLISDDIRLSRWLAERVNEHPELELFTQSLSIATFRYVPPELRGQSGAEVDARLNKLNQELLDRLQRSGEAFLSNAVVGGRYLLRPCIVNFHTNRSDLTALLDTVVNLGRQIHASRS